MMLRIQMETAASNEAIQQGTLEKTVEDAMAELRPEAAYFTVGDGCRTAYVFFDMDDASLMPKISEPFFMRLHAKIDYTPVMDREDLRKGLAALGR
ncbi:DUF3303 family protein [Streptomyces sp. NPDC048018]|uniref:DUF3303 family protein n=1 Tax=Streptomyces sp. NPDC048018 TaxID=3365499 RepID=UPI00371A70E8